MKKAKKIIVGILSAIMLFGVGACNDGKSNGYPLPPDYSQSALQFDFYGYSGVTDGTWSVDGVEYTAGEDFRTVERLTEYKDAGMTIVFPQSAGGYSGQDFETSDLKNIMECAVEAGIPKVIVTDSRIQQISMLPGGGTLIGEGKRFADEKALDEYIAQCVAPYKDHEAFYGIQLGDEPAYTQFTSYGEVYKSIKRVLPSAFVQMNVLPMILNPDDRWPTVEDTEGLSPDEIRMAPFKKYLEMYFDATGADYLMYDQYPLLDTSIYSTYIPCLQTAAKVCKERGADLHFVSQTMNMSSNGSYQRYMSEDDCHWINDMLVGFGVKTIAYFTYYTKQYNMTNGEIFHDGGSFVTHYGEKTDIYYYMQKIMAQEQKFAPVVLNFDYQTSNVYSSNIVQYPSPQTSLALKGDDFQKITNIEVNKETALVTELKDAKNDRYMYMVQNVVDPQYKGSAAYQTVTVTFGEGFTHAVLYHQGESKVVALDNGSVSVKQHPGYATYILPY